MPFLFLIIWIEFQTKLAEQLTLLVHGKEGLDMASKTTSILYSGDDVTQTLSLLTRYSKCSKSERSDFGVFGFGSVVESFRFWTFGWSTSISWSVQILDALASLDRTKKSSNWTNKVQTARTAWLKSASPITEPNLVRFAKPNVRISVRYCNHKVVYVMYISD